MNHYKRTIIQLTPEQHAALRLRAFRKKTSISGLIRLAIDSYLQTKA